MKSEKKGTIPLLVEQTFEKHIAFMTLFDTFWCFKL